MLRLVGLGGVRVLGLVVVRLGLFRVCGGQMSVRLLRRLVGFAWLRVIGLAVVRLAFSRLC